jgi:hypothetical protein
MRGSGAGRAPSGISEPLSQTDADLRIKNKSHESLQSQDFGGAR